MPEIKESKPEAKTNSGPVPDLKPAKPTNEEMEKFILDAGWEPVAGTHPSQPKFSNTLSFDYTQDRHLIHVPHGVVRTLSEAFELEAKRPMPILDADGEPVLDEKRNVRKAPRSSALHKQFKAKVEAVKK